MACTLLSKIDEWLQLRRFEPKKMKGHTAYVLDKDATFFKCEQLCDLVKSKTLLHF